jgi:hypothetical protein
MNAGSHQKWHWFILISLLALELTTRIIKVQSKFSLNAYTCYIATECRAKYPDMFVIKTVYECAIAEATKQCFNEESGAEEALRLFWVSYCDILVRFTYSDTVITSSPMSAFRCTWRPFAMPDTSSPAIRKSSSLRNGGSPMSQRRTTSNSRTRRRSCSASSFP